MKNLRKKISYAIYIVLITALMMSCDSNEGILGWSNEINSEGLKSSYKTIEIEGCEYIMYDAGKGCAGNGFLAHKGNCKNH